MEENIKNIPIEDVPEDTEPTIEQLDAELDKALEAYRKIKAMMEECDDKEGDKYFNLSLVQFNISNYMEMLDDKICEIRSRMEPEQKMTSLNFDEGTYAIPPKVSVQRENLKHLTEQDIQESGILSVIAQEAEYIRKKFLDKSMTMISKDPEIQEQAYQEYVCCVLDKQVEQLSSETLPEMDCDDIVAYLSSYASGGLTEYHYFDVATVATLCNMEVIVPARASVWISDVSGPGRSHPTYKIINKVTLAHLKAIVILDAAMDHLRCKLNDIMLEVEAIFKSQEIYMIYASRMAQVLTEKYSGKTRVCHKRNRMSVHFYLSETEKAFITFFKEQMPWTLPDPPIDPESLRARCSEGQSPFSLVQISRQDKSFLGRTP